MLNGARRGAVKTLANGVLLVFAAAFAGCGANADAPARIWTDSPEIVSYVELFNSSQDEYRVIAEYRENPAKALQTENGAPDIVIGSWLKSEKNRVHFIPLDRMFRKTLLNSEQNVFYEALLKAGNINGKQYLLPVSFNLPAAVFSNNTNAFDGSAFVLPLDDLRDITREYNEKEGAFYSRMGFLPREDANFLYTAAVLYGARFREGGSLFLWDANALARAVEYLRDWTSGAGVSASQEDDFAFKYLYIPTEKALAEGRILAAYMSSETLFGLSENKSSELNFRWITMDGLIPVDDDAIYLGVCGRGKNRRAAREFILWFYDESVQEALLQRARRPGLMNKTFGVANGFSAVKKVNEQILPKFYPQLLGRLPQLTNLLVPEILPADWGKIKNAAVLPYLTESIAGGPAASLGRRIENYLKEN